MADSMIGKLGLTALCAAVILVVRGDIAWAAIAVLIVLVLRVFVLIADVFWTCFTGRPLVRAHGAQDVDGSESFRDAAAPVGPFARLSTLPVPMRLVSRRQVSVFSVPRIEAMPAKPSRRLRALKARLGYF